MARLTFISAAMLATCVACNSGGGGRGLSDDGAAARSDGLQGWLSWRGPDQNGTSPETGLFDTLEVGGKNHRWSYDIKGRGAPVIAHGRVFGLGYENEGPELEEVLFCLDERTGKLQWEHRWSDFLSDTIYSRYSIGSPTIDPETGNVYSLTGAGLIHGFTPDGDPLWSRSMMEELGRLTFPNGRIGAPLIVGDTVVIHFIFASWGPMGPASDRFFGFDKHTGEVVWSSSPGVRPFDSTFSTPVVEVRDGRTLAYAGLGGGSLACIDVRTGDAIWRYPLAVGGVNSSALIHGDKLIAVHGRENIDSSSIGRMVALDLNAKPNAEGVLGKEAELWRNGLVAFTSSPVLVGNRVYLTSQTGELNCVDVDTGKVLWHEKIGPDQLHASPVYADGKLYIPVNNGSFHVIRPSDEGAELLARVQLEGNCLGAPSVANGCVYVHTTKKLYCFGRGNDQAPVWPAPERVTPGKAARLQFIPADVTLRVGDAPTSFRLRSLDASGHTVAAVFPGADAFETAPYVSIAADSTWHAKRAGVTLVKASYKGLEGAARVRVVPRLPLHQNFDAIELNQEMSTWAFPPGHWLGGRIKWKVIDLDGERVMARRMERPLFQRTQTLLGHPDESNYTVQADMMSDGNRRTLSNPGLINQRYLISMRGNHQELEIASNEEHLKVAVPFKWKARVWHTMKTRVDLRADGTAVVRAKVWPRDQQEPDAWTLEALDPHGHTHGAFGVYGFTPQSRFAVYLDNLSVTPND